MAGRGEVRFKLVAEVEQVKNALNEVKSQVSALGNELAGRLGPAGSVLKSLGPAGLAAAAGLGASVAAAGAFANEMKRVIDAAGQLNDLSARVGVSTQALQELAYAGSLVGVSQEAIIGAMGKAQVVLAEGNAKTIEALDKLGAAGITRSVMILNGLGGKVYTHQHAENSARLANATQPEYLATLVVSFPQGEQRLRAGFPEWEPLDQHELFVEMEQFLSQLELKRTVFRSDHASNWLVLKGTLGADKPRLLEQLRSAIAAPEAARLRPAWARGL